MTYRYYKPKDKITKLSEYFDLLDGLLHRPQGYSENELRSNIERSRGTNSPDTDYIFNTLINYGLIVENHDLQPRYILGIPYRTLLEYLHQDSHPVNSAVIQGYIEALQKSTQNLQKAYGNQSETLTLTLKHLQILGREMESIGETSSRNRLGVINEVRKLRVNADHLGYKERLAEANRLWDEYLEPLREMILPTGSFGQIMQKLQQALNQGEALFNAKVIVRHQLSLNRTYCIRLQEQARHDLNEASAELKPLRDKLIDESRLLKATSLLFDYIEQGNLNSYPSLPLGRQLTHERETNLYGLGSWLAELWSIQNTPDSMVFDEEEEVETEPLETESLMKLLADIPADIDLIEYFQQRYTNLSANQVLRAISILTLHQNDVSLHLKATDKQYRIGNQLWQGHSYQKVPETGK